MSLTIISGLPGAPRQARLISAITAKAAEGRSALLVVPAPERGAALRAATAATSPVGMRVATLDGIIRNQWSLHGDGRAILSGLPADVLAARALTDAGITDHPGRGAVSLLRAIASRRASVAVPIPETRNGLAGKILDALEIYEAAVVTRGLVERSEAARSLLSATPPAEVIGFVGFTTFDPAEEALVGAWSRSADVFIDVPTTQGHVATQSLQRLCDRLVTACDVDEIHCVVDDGRPSELVRVGEQLFGDAVPGPAEGAVRLGLAQGAEAEARLIVRIVRDVLGSGAEPSSIAIAFPDLSVHRGWLEHELRAAQVPAAVGIEEPVMRTPIGRALLRLWSFWSRGMRREDLLAFLRSGFAGVELSVADRVDRAIRRAGDVRGAGVVSTAGASRPLLEKCHRLVDAPIDARTAQQWKSLADSLMANAYGTESPRVRSDAVVDAATHRHFCGMLEQALEAGEGMISAAQLMDAFAGSTIRVDAPRVAGHVVVTSLDGLTGGDLDHVIIGGMTAREIPRRGSEERLQGDAVGAVVAALGIAADASERVLAERLAFYLAVTAPKRSLALVRQETDDDGAAVRASVFWDEFLDLYRNPGATEWPDTAPRLLRFEDAERREGPRRRQRAALSLGTPLLGDPPQAVSTSAIESYAGCPYRWFVERRLAPAAPDITFDRAAAGTLAHDTLARFQVRMRSHVERVTTENVEWAVSVAAECYAEAASETRARPSTLDERRLQADVWPAVERMVRRDAVFLPGFVPAHAEWSFGLDGEEPVVIDGLSVKGRADRIDVGTDGIVVIDYKLSRVFPLAKIQKNHLLQLQLYAWAASERLGLPIVGGLYRSLKTGESRGFMLSDHGTGFVSKDLIDREELDAFVESSVQQASAAVRGMMSGTITPAPDRDRCAYCLASAFCAEAVL